MQLQALPFLAGPCDDACRPAAPRAFSSADALPQSIFSAMILGFGPGLGGIVGGQIMQAWGAQIMFAITSAVVLGGWLAALAFDAAAALHARRAAATATAGKGADGQAGAPGMAPPAAKQRRGRRLAPSCFSRTLASPVLPAGYKGSDEAL
jgi:hypothetical protein